MPFELVIVKIGSVMPVPLPVILLVVTLAARAAGMVVPALDSWHDALRIGLAAVYLLAASGRAVPRVRHALERMVPPGLPRPDLLVAGTGILEAAGAIGLLVPATASAAAVCLGLLTLAMTPANISAARRGLELGGKPVTPVGRRLVEQALYVGACAAVVWLPY
ncbi:DoxX family protein [Myceligenerans salitolerans]|uniref:DoxX family protein n=1 Tax=Myceligenerans salitolerans TaxID=1230528 RepID=A0ABS3IBA6_9MICO|nr:DoxX family protein [Myceligenerans salitolerans]MBO0610282.1 DoxX family protein [Myceligenerans salitolerans]